MVCTVQVTTAISEFLRVLKPAGGLCISVLPNETSHRGSCHTRVPRSVFAALAPAAAVVGLEEMDDWGLPHSFGRYSVCLRKGDTEQPLQRDPPAFETIKDAQTYSHSKTRKWYSENLPQPSEVGGWTEEERDRRLYLLSRWDRFDPAQFQECVRRQILPLNISAASRFSFLEVGVGVGAFARRVLQLYPGASGHGIDLEAEAVAVAARVLPPARMNVSVGTMLDLRFAAETFEYVFVPGCLCYLRSLDQVPLLLA